MDKNNLYRGLEYDGSSDLQPGTMTLLKSRLDGNEFENYCEKDLQPLLPYALTVDPEPLQGDDRHSRVDTPTIQPVKSLLAADDMDPDILALFVQAMNAADFRTVSTGKE